MFDFGERCATVPPLPTACYMLSVLCVVMGCMWVGGSLVHKLAGQICVKDQCLCTNFLAICVSILGGVIAMRPTAGGPQGSHPGQGSRDELWIIRSSSSGTRSHLKLATRHPDGEVCGHIIIPASSVAGDFWSSLRRVLIGWRQGIQLEEHAWVRHLSLFFWCNNSHQLRQRQYRLLLFLDAVLPAVAS